MISFHINEADIDGAVTQLQAQANMAVEEIQQRLHSVFIEMQNKIDTLGKMQTSSNIQVALDYHDDGMTATFELYIPYENNGKVLARKQNNPYWQRRENFPYFGQPFQEVLQAYGWEVTNYPLDTPIPSGNVKGGHIPRTILKIKPGASLLARITP